MRLLNKTLYLLMALLASATAAQATEKVMIATADGGTVTVDKLNPSSGETVFVTVTPNEGYMIAKSDITVEATIDPSKAQAPAMAAPAVGYFLPLDGEQPVNISDQATYSFVMVEEPLNVLITAHFRQQSTTGVDNVTTSQSVTAIRYVDLSGHVSNVPFHGINLVVTTRADGTTETTKLLK